MAANGLPVTEECNDGNDNDGVSGCDYEGCAVDPNGDPKCSCNSADECGGSAWDFNLCDRAECLACGGTNYFVEYTWLPGFGRCYSCTAETQCTNYSNDYVTCNADYCGLANPPFKCSWNIGQSYCQNDTDGDGIVDDGDRSGVIGDHPCTPADIPDGNTSCDDNCLFVFNPDQANEDSDSNGTQCERCPLEPTLLLPSEYPREDTCIDGVDNDCDNTSDCSGNIFGLPPDSSDCSSELIQCGGSWPWRCDSNNVSEDWLSIDYTMMCDNGTRFNWQNSSVCDMRYVSKSGYSISGYEGAFFFNTSAKWMAQTPCIDQSPQTCFAGIYWLNTSHKNESCCLAGTCNGTVIASCSGGDGCRPDCPDDPDCVGATCVADDKCVYDCHELPPGPPWFGGSIDPDCGGTIYTDRSPFLCEMIDAPADPQQICDTDNEPNCWDDKGDLQNQFSMCCGDDNLEDDFNDTLGNVCVDGKYYLFDLLPNKDRLKNGAWADTIQSIYVYTCFYNPNSCYILYL